MQCLRCQTENRAGGRFCAECGAKLTLTCTSCGFANEPWEKFCGGCGMALEKLTPAGAHRRHLKDFIVRISLFHEVDRG